MPKTDFSEGMERETLEQVARKAAEKGAQEGLEAFARSMGCETPEPAGKCPETGTLAPNSAHWDKGTWENRSTSGFIHRHLVNWLLLSGQ